MDSDVVNGFGNSQLLRRDCHMKLATVNPTATAYQTACVEFELKLTCVAGYARLPNCCRQFLSVNPA